MRAYLLVLLMLVSGCLGATPPPSEPSPTPTASPGFIAFEGCKEFNIVEQQPAILDSFHPQVRPTRTAPGLTPRLNTIDSCASATTPNGTTNAAIFFSIGIPVEEIPDARIPDALGYILIVDLSTPIDLVADAFAPYYAVRPEAVAAQFSALGPLADGRSAGSVGEGDGAIRFETTMTQPSAAGSGGKLGVYSIDQKWLRAHTVTFSAYQSYPTGTGTIQYPAGEGPVAGGAEPSAWQANHNVAFDVRFDFDTVVVKAYP